MKSSVLRRHLILTLIVSGIVGYYPSLTAQTWEGDVSNNWLIAGNWSTNTVPDGTQDVIIPSGTPNNPIIPSSIAYAKNLTINAGATLTIQISADLILPHTSIGKLTNNGTIVNNGEVMIDWTDGDAFTNNGTMTNQVSGAILIGAVLPAGNITGRAISNTGVFTNLGDMTIKGSVNYGIYNNAGATFINEDDITINDITDEGIRNHGIFNNLNGGSILIGTLSGVNNISEDGLQNEGEFLNDATSVITVRNVGLRGVLVGASTVSFTNPGTININHTGDDGIYGDDAGFYNSGVINVGTNGGGIGLQGFQTGVNSIYHVTINGTAPGQSTGYAQANVVGTVQLAGGLDLTGTHNPASGEEYLLINNDGADPVTGTFSGLPNGTNILLNGIQLKIFYNGGDGNDVVLKFSPDQFVTTWKTDNPGTTNNQQIRIPITGGGYNYSVNWGDGMTNSGVTGTITHTYSTPGTYQVVINGTFPRIFMFFSGEEQKLLSVDQWGPNAWTSMENAFYGCSNLVLNATDAPNLSGLTSVLGMFEDCSAMNLSTTGM